MFSYTTMATKRRRDDDDSDSDEGAGFGRERQQLKKSRTWFSDPVPHSPMQQSLPLRPSLTPPRLPSDIEAMTPAQSDWEEDTPTSAYGGPVQSSQSNDFDMEMDDDDDFDVRSQPQSPFASNLFMRPAMLNASLFGADPGNANGRLPTPIHPTFRRGGMNGLGFPTSGSAGSISTPTMQAPTSRKARQDIDDDRSRRMPSPISEDEDIPDTPTALTQSQLSRLSFSQANPADMMDMEAPSALPLLPTPKGRKRSGALTGMGRFSMGYREDCEKCRTRVPGHYSHFL
ncbi:hypothetical protein DE146DRAFT_654967 [Phaeosphaeria sp. MPI-PUGE-AT-0046c]|nr:hypothetical protein DE146DRAFT_654967 [Phaeosphaeria sp. MPI-PUGE-AT-0046c]